MDRLACHAPVLQMATRFGVDLTMPEWPPRYRIRPLEDVPTIIQDKRSRRLGRMRWGWARDAKSKAVPILAMRAEEAASSQAGAFAHRRAVVLATAWYLFTRTADAPAWVVVPDQSAPVGIAAVWRTERNGDSEHAAVSLLTVPALDALKGLSPRMPALLSYAMVEDWLDPTASAAQLRRVLKPTSFESLDAFPVGPDAVDDAAAEHAGMLLPMADRTDLA